ncbi:MAG TPA: anthrone oxygenase family protein [Steroidobacteraceae bacterium]|nr:anthrone oxygenase family protein [Steroidobacteraceae bacterium]
MNPLDLLALVTALGSGLVAGFFFSFSVVVMQSLGKIPAPADVPRNNALAGLAPESAEAAKYWLDYLSTWTAWNHVRTIAPLVSAALFAWALRLRG